VSAARDWKPIAGAPLDATMVEVLVPTRDGGFIEGRARFEPQAYDGTWWWEDTQPGDYACDNIAEINHGDPLYWRAIEQPTDAVEWLARRFYMERPASYDGPFGWEEAQNEAAPYVADLRRFAAMAIAVARPTKAG
jgi:hypothetical protein